MGNSSLRLSGLKNGGVVTDIDPLTISSRFSNTLNNGMGSGVSYYCIYGMRQNKNTDRDMKIVQTNNNWYKQQGKIVKAHGDGYITAESAMAFGTPIAVSGNGITHSGLMNNGQVQVNILNILNTVP